MILYVEGDLCSTLIRPVAFYLIASWWLAARVYKMPKLGHFLLYTMCLFGTGTVQLMQTSPLFLFYRFHFPFIGSWRIQYS